MKTVLKLLGAIGISLVMTTPASAIPTLQLDIGGGTYVPETPSVDGPGGTTYSSGAQFTLYGYLIEDSKNKIGDTYYISAAVVPRLDEATDLGSFSYGTQTVNVTADMTYGLPPVEEYTGTPDKDLSGHGIFDTYFSEFEVHFNAGDYTQAYDVAGSGEFSAYSGGTKMYYVAIDVDTSGLTEGTAIHFDLYNTSLKVYGDEYVAGGSFAPFSHDAESRNVPEPGTLYLLGSGLIGLGLMRRRKNA